VGFYRKAFEQIGKVLADHSHGIRFYGASILLIYCAESLKRALDSQDDSQLLAQCRLVDFQKVKIYSPVSTEDSAGAEREFSG